MSNNYVRFVKHKQRKVDLTMRTYKIYLIRHGMTSGNVEGRYVGITDNDLCEEGVNEILELKEKFEYPNVGRVYSSPLKRAIQTARLIYPEITPIVVNSLRESNFGDFEGKRFEDLKDLPEFTEWMSSEYNVAPPNGESMKEIEKRVVEGFNDIILDMMKNKVSEVALVTHGGVIRSLLALCGLPKRPLNEWGVKNGTGYTALINAQLWGNNKAFEVFTPIPYGTKTDEVMMDYQRHWFTEEE